MKDLPNGAWLKIKKENETILDCRLFVSNLLSFNDCVPIAPESREAVIKNSLADIVLESVDQEKIAILDLNKNETVSLNLGEELTINSKEHGQVQVILYGVRINANESSWDEWIIVK